MSDRADGVGLLGIALLLLVFFCWQPLQAVAGAEIGGDFVAGKYVPLDYRDVVDKCDRETDKFHGTRDRISPNDWYGAHVDCLKKEIFAIADYMMKTAYVEPFKVKFERLLKSTGSLFETVYDLRPDCACDTTGIFVNEGIDQVVVSILEELVHEKNSEKYTPDNPTQKERDYIDGGRNGDPP
ncbi:MAG: hypothetical protein HQL66_04175 [Magnetococcales bacterium]|nr:hypothetical protein [Magnetococcales bacterium]